MERPAATRYDALRIPGLQSYRTPTLPEAESQKPRYGLWALAILGWWTFQGFAFATQYYVLRAATESPIEFRDAFVSAILSAYLSIPATILALWLGSRYRIERGRWRSSLALHTAVALIIVWARAAVVAGLNQWVGWYAELPPFGQILLTSFTNNFFLYWMLLGVAHAVHYARAARRRERMTQLLQTELVRTQLNALKAQLHPHFLFNTLNTVISLVHTDPMAAERMIARLSDLLRRTLRQSGADEIALAEELDFLRAYVEIEQARFEDRLRVSWRIDPEAMEALIPPLILQPLVENSIQHGLAPRMAAGLLEISAQRSGSTLMIEIEDDGLGFSGDPAESDGLGLSTTRSRLERTYGAHHSFVVKPASDDGGVKVALRLPFRTLEGAAGGAGDS